MKIGIDISQVIYGTGVSTYTENLVKNLLLIDKKNEYVLFGGSLRRKDELKSFVNKLEGKNFESKIATFPPTLAAFLWNKLHLVRIERYIGDVDVFHSTDWAEPPSKARKVTTIHDLSPFRFPKLTNPTITSVNKAKLKWIKREVKKIIVPSEATKEDLVLLKIPRERIVVIPEAADPFYKPAKKEEVKKIKRKYKVENYLLGVGVNPRKNTKRIIKAFEMMRADRDLKLILVGQVWQEHEDMRNVRFTNFISKKELRALYTGAKALVYPSIYEGYGLPILEAFACKTPVVTSNLSSMPEVSGKAAVLVDPYNEEDIAEGIKKALKDERKLVKKGTKRLMQYSWKDTAQKTLEVYENLMKEN